MTQSTKVHKSFLQRVWDVVFVIFYPILVAFSLLFVGLVYLFSALSWLVSWLLPRPKETATEASAPTWETWVKNADLSVERIFVDEIMFGPTYYQLRTLPSSEAVSTHYFGDFYHECFGGVLLQKWNTIVPRELPNFDLLFFDGQTGELRYLKTIRAFTWRAEETIKGITLHWRDEQASGSIDLTEDQVRRDARVLD